MQRLCYVIMPFNARCDPAYRDGIQPALKAVAAQLEEGWECRRADDVRMPGCITKEIVTSLHTADLVVADLTGHNPNVFYELAVAHSNGRPTVMIAQSAKDIPFDIKTYRVLMYTPSAEGLSKLRDDLTKCVLDLLLNRERRVMSPVLDFAPVPYAHLLLNLAEVRTMEGRVTHEVWLIEPSLDADLKILAETAKHNLRERNIRYRYLLPDSPNIAIQWSRFVDELGYGSEPPPALKARTVKAHLIESEVVIYDPYSEREDVLIMSPREQDSVFWYRVGRTRGESIRNRYELLWKEESAPLTTGS